MKKSILLAIILLFSNFNSHAGNVTSVCTWKPPKSVGAIELNANEIYIEQSGKAEWKKNTDNDYFVLTPKGRSHFYSMPNMQCRSDTFIVQGDVVEYLQGTREGDALDQEKKNFTQKWKIDILNEESSKNILKISGCT